MKIKPVYIYLISFVIIIGIIVIFSTTSNDEGLPTEQVNPHSEMPNDEVHKNLEDAPGSGNVKSSAREKLELLEDKYNENPSDTANAQEYARMLAAAHQPEKAVEIYEGILSSDENRMDVRFELATVYYNLQKYDEAKEQLQIALNYDPNNLEAKYNLGAIEASQGNKEKAKEYWTDIVENHPESDVANIAKSSLQRLEGNQ